MVHATIGPMQVSCTPQRNFKADIFVQRTSFLLQKMKYSIA